MPLCQLSSKRLEDNWHSDLLSSTKQRLSGVRLPVGRKWLAIIYMTVAGACFPRLAGHQVEEHRAWVALVYVYMARGRSS